VTLDDLEKTYWNAAQAHWLAHQDDKSANNMSRAGIRVEKQLKENSHDK